MIEQKEKQEQSKKKLLENGDKIVFTIPRVDHNVTINEIHAMQLGLSGFIVGTMYSSGMEKSSAVLAAVLVGYAIIGKPIFKSLNHDAPDYKTIGMKTIKHEPWWFISIFMLLFFVGMQ